ncbi:MAG: hypothetical protein KatS3mg090_0651 [Patescibacteria group bacterium]|nr:MAG: hypothetical protein KatS3mg090_0651 [Patescibacteria group bacterium]
MSSKKLISLTLILLITLFQNAFFLIYPVNKVFAQVNPSLQNASVTLTNSRLSFRAGVGTGGIASGASTATIDSSGNPDTDLNHLFPNDQICFYSTTATGCIDNQTFTVTAILNSGSGGSFQFDPALSNAVSQNDLVIASQSARHTISFKPQSTVNGGKIVVKIPAASTNYNDGAPDDTGFDSSLLTNSNIDTYIQSVSGITKTGTTLTYSSGYHVITISFSNNITSSTTVSFTIGDATDSRYRFINPAPASGHTRGTADTYSVIVETQTSGGTTVDKSTLKVAPVEGVFVSVKVEESIAFKVCGVQSNLNPSSGCTFTSTPSTVCGLNSLSISSQPYAINYESITSWSTFFNAAQYLEVSTNAPNGYAVTIEEDDQLGLNGNACTGTSPSSGTYTFGSGTCIADTTCDNGSCTQTTADEWNTASNHGFGYSLDNLSGTDAVFEYSDTAGTCTGTFCAKQIADTGEREGTAQETKQTIMTASAPVNQSSAFVCFRLSVSNTQPAGLYYNTVKYVATATF